MNHVTHPLSSADISNFSPEISKFCYIKKYMYRVHFDTKLLLIQNSFNFSWVYKDCFNKKSFNFGDVSKMATPGLFKIKIFWKKGYDVIIYVHDVTNKILSCDSNYIVDVVMWPKFGNPSISMREVIIISIL